MANRQSPYSGFRFRLLFAGWWVLWMLMHVIVMHRLGFNWRLAMFDSLVANVLLAVLSLLSMAMYRYYQPGRDNRMMRLVYAFGISILYTFLLLRILTVLLPNETFYLHIVALSMPLRFVLAFLIIAFISILNWLWSSLQEQNKLTERRNEMEKLAKEAELVKLRQQLQPHFLFNSLNSISALAASKPDEARKMIQQLSDFLRGTLKKDEEKTVAINEELKQLDLYLQIEKVRFGHRLQVTVNTEENCRNTIIPPMLLQPLVENAIKFGLYGTLGDVQIVINARCENNFLHIEISNPFDPETSDNNAGTGFGLSSVERRLFLIYGRNDLLSTQRNDQTFITTLKIPQ